MSWVVEVIRTDGREGQAISRHRVTGTLRIGRALDNDIVVDDPYAAAYHAVVSVNEAGVASVQDLGTLNGTTSLSRDETRGLVARLKSWLGRSTNRAQTEFEVTADESFRLGQSTIRLRTLDASRAPERPLVRRVVWPLALLILSLALAHGVWRIWLGHTENRVPQYLYDVSGQALLICLWSGAYALLGRVLGGRDRFFSHLLIASLGYLSLVVVDSALDHLAFAFNWLWPLWLKPTVNVIVAAFVVRAHLRIADPRHWPALRYTVALVAAIAIALPPTQLWIQRDKLTNVQVIGLGQHPMWRIAAPEAIAAHRTAATELKAAVDEAKRKAKKTGDEDSDAFDGAGGQEGM